MGGVLALAVLLVFVSAPSGVMAAPSGGVPTVRRSAPDPLAPLWAAYRARRFHRVKVGLARLPAAAKKRPGARFLGAVVDLEEGRAAAAATAFAGIPLTHRLGLSAVYNRALSLIALGQMDAAVDCVRALAPKRRLLPRGRWEAAAAVIHSSALALLARGRADLARRLLRVLLRHFPRTAAARHAAPLVRPTRPPRPADPGRGPLPRGPRSPPARRPTERAGTARP